MPDTPITDGRLRGWSIRRHAPATCVVNANSIRLTTDGGSMWGAGKTAQNLVLHPLLEPPFVICAQIDLLPVNDGEQAGLILYRDDDNYVKLVREQVKDQVIVIAQEVEGKPSPVQFIPCTSGSVVLTATARGRDIFLAWHSVDGSAVGEYTLPNPLEPFTGLQPGLLAHGKNPDNQARFEHIAVTQL